MNLTQEWIDKFCRSFADRLEGKYFDESAVDYEAARLADKPVVIVCWHNGADLERNDFSKASPEFLCAKGDAELKRHIRGEIPSLEFEAVYALNKEAAYALRTALLRRAANIRLVK